MTGWSSITQRLIERIEQWQNKKRTRQNKFRGFTRLHLILHCYDLKLELRLHLGKGLREVKGDI